MPISFSIFSASFILVIVLLLSVIEAVKFFKKRIHI